MDDERRIMISQYDRDSYPGVFCLDPDTIVVVHLKK